MRLKSLFLKDKSTYNLIKLLGIAMNKEEL